jgi:hypothetical protein
VNLYKTNGIPLAFLHVGELMGGIEAIMIKVYKEVFGKYLTWRKLP